MPAKPAWLEFVFLMFFATALASHKGHRLFRRTYGTQFSASPTDKRGAMMYSTPFLFQLAWRLAFAGVLLLTLNTAIGAQFTALVLDQRSDIPAWPAVSVMSDPSGEATINEVLARRGEFEVPVGTNGNLGRRRDTVWLRIPVNVPGDRAVRRVIEFDYPALNLIDLYTVRNDTVFVHRTMGNELLMEERPYQTRTHAAVLTFLPGDSELLVRVETLSTMVLPISILTTDAFIAQELGAQIVQGVILGLAMCMLIYSLMHWISLRDIVFLQYAFLLCGNVLFTLCYFGVGAQYLWPQWPEMSLWMSPVGMLVSVAAGASFMHATLAVDEISPLTSRVLRLIRTVALIGLIATVTGLLSYRVVQPLIVMLGVSVTISVLPVAFIRAWRGERVTMLMLLGWSVYTVGALTIAGLLSGQVEPTYWTQHLFPFSTMFEMTAWMAVLGFRVRSVQRKAVSALIEADTQRMLAETDVLTGLPNRRGLQKNIERSMRCCAPDKIFALYLLDLNGFKAANDRWGHDAGDALLIAVGVRLQQQLRATDIVARLGGDEFVVLAKDLGDESQAFAFGQKLAAAFEPSFDVPGRKCHVGVTIGYALAPLDSGEGGTLMKIADAAMYAGKKSGCGGVRRGGACLEITEPSASQNAEPESGDDPLQPVLVKVRGNAWLDDLEIR